MLVLNKTKAALQGRQCHTTNTTEPGQIITVIGLVNSSVMHTALSGEAEKHNRIWSFQAGLSLSESVAAGGSPEKSGDSRRNRRLLHPGFQIRPHQTPDMADAHPFSHITSRKKLIQCFEKKRYIQKETTITTIIIVCHGLIISRSPLESGYQPFVSMPRCVSSLRMMRFIQAAKDSSPSSCCAFSIIALSSGSKRNWNGGLPRLSLLCVDTLITPDVMCLCVMTHYTHNVKKATPRSAGTLPRRLTKPLVGVTIMAESQSTQTRPKFTWRFLAVNKSTPDMRPIALYTNAPTEEEARERLPGWILYFAARLPLHIPEPVGVNHA